MHRKPYLALCSRIFAVWAVLAAPAAESGAQPPPAPDPEDFAWHDDFSTVAAWQAQPDWFGNAQAWSGAGHQVIAVEAYR